MPRSCRVVRVILADYLCDDSRTGVPDRLPCEKGTFWSSTYLSYKACNSKNVNACKIWVIEKANGRTTLRLTGIVRL
jgi:hypothetical protein